MTYTDDDVQRLVSEAKHIHDCWKQGVNINLIGPVPGLLADALKPFRPDPEEELIEAMCDAFNKELDYKAYIDHTDFSRERMRAALAVVREKGLPK